MASTANLFFKPRLLTPGPSPVPDFVHAAMQTGVYYHRSPEFATVMNECRDSLKKVFGTKEDVLMLTGSGTLSMEAALVSLFNRGDAVIAVNSGKFGARWVEQSKVYGLAVHEIKVDAGKCVDVLEVERLAKANPGVRAILVHASETSTSVRHDLKSIAKIAQGLKDCLTIVDGITAVGIVEVPMDKWGIDVLCSGSQKGFMLPPGLSLIALSQKAWARTANVTIQGYYMDLRKERKAQAEGSTAFTGAVTLIAGLHATLKFIESQGIPEFFESRWKMVSATRAALRALGLKLFVEDENAYSPACTAVHTEGLVANKDLKTAYGLTVAGGQDELKGKIIRIGHLGYMDAWDVLNQIMALGWVFAAKGKNVDIAAAVNTFHRELGSAESRVPQNWRI
ncbi:MAG TPA: alanine--glyoxylate aminotransferase family protein [Bdellovibrionota bacterium]|jgi:aspartate aminotransferase-like enzyme|nr:alanine--glyoxylate aminotransferase family protein [Bdellovibrionota bacterium]